MGRTHFNDYSIQDPECSVIRPVRNVYIPGDYNPNGNLNDIALLKVDPVSYANCIQPICLPRNNDNLYVGYTATGKIISLIHNSNFVGRS